MEFIKPGRKLTPAGKAIEAKVQRAKALAKPPLGALITYDGREYTIRLGPVELAEIIEAFETAGQTDSPVAKQLVEALAASQE